jgi:hypothetical protein
VPGHERRSTRLARIKKPIDGLQNALRCERTVGNKRRLKYGEGEAGRR